MRESSRRRGCGAAGHFTEMDNFHPFYTPARRSLLLGDSRGDTTKCSRHPNWLPRRTHDELILKQDVDWKSTRPMLDETAPLNKPFVEAVTLLQASKNEPLAPAKLALLEQAKAAFQTIIEQYSPTVLAVNQIEAARATYACVIGQAMALAHTITDNEERARAMANIAEVQAGAGNRTGAHESFTQALAAAEHTSDEQHVRLLADTAGAQARAGDRAGARKSFTQAIKFANTIIGKEWAEWNSLADVAKAHAQALVHIAGAQARVGDRVGARESFAQAIKIAHTIQNEIDRAQVLAAIAEGQARVLVYIAEADDVARPVVVARTITNEWRKACTLYGFIRNLRDWDLLAEEQTQAFIRIAEKQAAETGEIAQPLPRTLTNKWERARVLAAIAEGQARAGDRPGAQISFSKALAVARAMDHGWPVRFLEWAVAIFAVVMTKIFKYGGWQTRVLADMSEEQTRALVHIAAGEAETGDSAETPVVWQARVLAGITKASVAVLSTLWHGSIGGRAMVLADIALAQGRADDRAGAKKTASQALAFAKTISHKFRRSLVLNRIAQAQVRAGSPAAAHETFAEALAEAQTITDNFERELMLADIAAVLAEAGGIAQALAVVQTVSSGEQGGVLAHIVAEARARAGDGAEALEIFDQVAEFALTLTNKKQQAQVLAFIAGGQAEAGEIAQSFVVAQTIVGPCTRLAGGGWAPCKEQQVRALSAIAQELAKTGDNKQAAELALKLTDEEQQVRVLATMTTGIEAARATYACVIDQAVAVARTIRDEEGRARALSGIAVAQARAGDHPGAQESFTQAIKVANTIAKTVWVMPPASADAQQSQALSDIALALAKAGDVEQAIELAQTIKGGWRDGALSGIAVARAKAGDLPQALAIMQTIDEQIIRHSVRAMSAIAKAQARAGDRPEAHKSFARAIKFVNTIIGKESAWRLSEVAEALVHIAEAQARAGDRAGAQESFTQAINVAQTITDEFRRDMTLSDIAVARAKVGDVPQALAMMQTITDTLIIGPHQSVLAMVAIAEAQARAGDRAGARESFAQAIKIAQTMTDEGWRDQVLSDIVEAQVRAGEDTAQALTLALAITDEGWRDQALSDIALGQAEAGDIAWAQMLAKTIADKYSQIRILAGITKAHIRAGDIKQALAFSQTLTDKEQQVRLLADIAEAQARAGECAGAHESFTQALAAAQAITDGWRQARGLSDLAEVLVLITGIQTHASST